MSLIQSKIDGLREKLEFAQLELTATKAELAAAMDVYRLADDRSDRLYMETVELEQEMADMRNELMRKSEMLRAAQEQKPYGAWNPMLWIPPLTNGSRMIAILIVCGVSIILCLI